MTEAEHLSRVIETIYDAAVKPDLWTGAMESACGFVGAAAANLFWQDAATNAAGVFRSWGDDPGYLPSYFEVYAAINPFFPALSFVPVGEVVAGGDLVPHEEFRETRFYREWVKPQGYIDVIGANLDRTAASSAMFSMRRSDSQGIVDNETRRKFALIVPHVRRAVAIDKIIDGHAIAERAMSASMEKMSAAIFLVRADRRIVYVNGKARALIESGEMFKERNGVLAVAETPGGLQLLDALAAAGGGDRRLGIKGVAVPVTDGGGVRHVAHVLSLASGSRQAASPDGEATAALFVREVAPALASSVEVLATIYRLTAGETKVLAALAAGGGNDDLAERLGVALPTVKTHLNHLLAKTGKRRQGDLIHLLAQHSNPLIG